MKTYARTIAVAVAVGIVGFFAAVGLVSVLFAPQVDSFAPKNSADAAAWIQAVGSIIAIGASYWLGERQARKARDHALEVFHLQRSRVEHGSQAVVVQLHKEIYAVRQTAIELDYESFVFSWKMFLLPTMTAAMAAFDHLPHHELGGHRRVSLAFDMRAQVQRAVMSITALLDEAYHADETAPESDQLDPQKGDAEDRVLYLRKITNDFFQSQTEMLAEFDANIHT
ncbi:hypothetical protein [Achromobacter sp. E1]|uniref:hypothetical protein n=1 Tax=Achromobacter sp. E1 TaxID=3141581 RepID=UPI0030CF92F4